jgi:hypothetical protein
LGYRGETEWCIAASGGTPAYAFSSANESVTFTGAASTTAIYLLQRLESRDTNRIKSKTVTFSCEISNSLLTSVIWEVFRPTTSDDVHGTIVTPTQTLIASGTFTVNSTLTRYSATFALPDLASRGLEVRLRVGAQTSGTWVVARLQLEEGSAATTFNCGEYTQELLKCKRYFEKIEGGVGGAFPAINRVSSETPMSLVDFSEKFNKPIISFPTNGSARYVHSSGVYTPVTLFPGATSSKNFILSGNTAPVSGYGWIDNVNDINISAHIP